MKPENDSQLTKNENKEKEIDLSRYKTFSSPSDKRLALGLWIIEHKKHLKAALVIFLFVVAAVSWSYTIYGFAYSLARGMNEDEILAEQLVQTQTVSHAYLVSLSPQDLIYSPAKMLRANEDKYDFITQIKNPNLKHGANFSYCFLEKDREIDCEDSFILPGETKNLLSLAQSFKSRPTNSKFVIKEISWQRINPHEFPDWESFRDEHLDISLEDIEFKPAPSSGLSEKLNLNTLKFKATNKTPYNYWEVPLTILLFSGNSIVGVNKYTLAEFMSREKREIEMSWLGSISGVNEVKIIPEINILKDDIYIKYEGGIGEEK